MKYPKCSCKQSVKSGKIKGKQRYKCKECGCNLKSTAKPQSLKMYFY
jgi:transposase-like protein